jgi:hypothetical protein
LPQLADARPVGLSIPAIRVEESTFERLSLGSGGELEPPADFAHVGWFTGGPVPGDSRPAVIAGHVDSRAGPAALNRLRELNPVIRSPFDARTTAK